MPSAEIESVRDLRRSQILDAARSIVARDGLGALTFGELERRLTFTRGVITYHFKNKEDIEHALLDETLRAIDQSAREAARRAPDPARAVERVIGAMVDGFLAHRDATHVLVSFWGRLQSDPRAREANASLYRTYRGQSAELVRSGQQRGVFRKSVDVDAAAAILVGAVIGIATQALFDEEAIDVPAAVRASGQSIAAWLAELPSSP